LTIVPLEVKTSQGCISRRASDALVFFAAMGTKQGDRLCRCSLWNY